MKPADKAFLLALGVGLLELLNVEGMEPSHDDLAKAIEDYDENDDEDDEDDE